MKSDNKREKQVLDISQLNTVEELDKAIIEHQHQVYRKNIFLGQIKESKKDAMDAFKEQMTVVNEELEFELSVVTSLFDRKKLLHGGSV